MENDDEDEDEDEVIDEEEVDDPLLRGEMDGQVVKLSQILEFDIHHVSSRKKKLDRYALFLVFPSFIIVMPV